MHGSILSREAYLKDYHRRRPGTTTMVFGRLPVEVDGERFESSYHYLADKVPRSHAPLRVLDLACGDGFLLAILASREQRGLELCGIDFSEEELAAAESRLRGGATLVHANAKQLPLANASIDVIVSHMALMLMDDVPTVVREIRRVLRPNGHFCAVVARPRKGADRDAVYPLIEAALKTAGVRDAVPWGDPRIMSPEGITELLREGFQSPVLRDLDCPLVPDPTAYWENLQGMYPVDILPAQVQSDLRARVLDAIAPLANAEGKVQTSFALRYFAAIAASAP